MGRLLREVVVTAITYPVRRLSQIHVVRGRIAGSNTDGMSGGPPRWLPRPSIRIPDFADNPHPASCGSDLVARYVHATSDVGAWLSNPNNRPEIGQLLRVRYDDDTSEAWIYRGLSTAPLDEQPAFPVSCPT